MTMPKSYAERRKERKPAGFRIFSPRTKGLMRVGVYLMVVLAVSSVFAGRSALAGVSEKALVTGRQLDKLQEFASGAERLMLNGQAINIGSATSTLSMEEVLDRFEGVCKLDSTLAHDFRDVDAMLHDDALKTFATKRNFGVIREQTVDDGVVACATRNPENGNRTTLDGFRKFAESWDVADVGLLRYAYVRRLENGRSHVLTVWTDGSFKLDAMLPGDDGTDALGTDPENVPRPPQATRYLTAAAEGRPHSVRIYESRQGAPEVLKMYETEMPKRGWTAIDTGDTAPEARYFERNGVDMLVVVEANGDRSMVSMVETGG
jgi:hypothetical protein